MQTQNSSWIDNLAVSCFPILIFFVFYLFLPLWNNVWLTDKFGSDIGPSSMGPVSHDTGPSPGPPTCPETSSLAKAIDIQVVAKEATQQHVQV